MTREGRKISKPILGQPAHDQKLIIWVFNLELDLDSVVLAAAHDWVEEFSKVASSVYVISTHVGRTNLSKNVASIELGGGSGIKRLIAVCRLLKLVPSLWVHRRSSIVFHHMSPRTVLVLGMFIRLMKIPQGLWYSHSKYSIQFRLARYLVNYIFTSTKGAAPGSNRKYRFIGHGISEVRFSRKSKKWQKTPREIISVGRVSPVKQIERLLNIFPITEEISKDINFRIELCGPIDKNSDYQKSLIAISKERNIQLEIVGAINYLDVPMKLRSVDIFYSGTPDSVDKAVIEAGMSGCLIISTNVSTLSLTGMSKAWLDILKTEPKGLQNQLRVISKLSEDQKDEMREIIWATTHANNRLSKTVENIVIPLNALRSLRHD